MSNQLLKEVLTRTISQLEENPSHSLVAFSANTRLEEGVRCSANVRDFPTMYIDEPEDLGGQNSAMNPVELLLVSLGTCQEIMYAAYAAVLGIQLDSVKVELKGKLDLRGLFGLAEGVPAGYREIHYVTKVKARIQPKLLKN
ncbi:OsmC family protein [Aliikangiella maris]|uniref:OsmC family protein n=2 Tax=Aliikangiella maris TaxID=3162458 RepID=A0ABV3MN40_9GAMM